MIANDMDSDSSDWLWLPGPKNELNTLGKSNLLNSTEIGNLSSKSMHTGQDQVDNPDDENAETSYSNQMLSPSQTRQRYLNLSQVG